MKAQGNTGAVGLVGAQRVKVAAAQTDAQGKMHVWSLLQGVERTLDTVDQTFRTVYPQHEVALKNVAFQLLTLPHKGDTLIFETRLVQLERKKFQFRVYVHIYKAGQKSKKVCRAKYDYHVVGSALVAQAG